MHAWNCVYKLSDLRKLIPYNFTFPNIYFSISTSESVKYSCYLQTYNRFGMGETIFEGLKSYVFQIKTQRNQLSISQFCQVFMCIVAGVVPDLKNDFLWVWVLFCRPIVFCFEKSETAYFSQGPKKNNFYLAAKGLLRFF